ncbi:MAG: hypothetical protein LKF36_05470 [Lactobacillus sp.]|nr:hypothetical protein [Lactobacillus sp.]
MDNNYIEQNVVNQALADLSLKYGQAVFEKAQLTTQNEALKKEIEKLKQEAKKDEPKDKQDH